MNRIKSKIADIKTAEIEEHLYSIIYFCPIVFSASSQESAFGVNCIPIHKRLKCIVFLHMTRHYEPEHEAAKHGGLQGVPIMTFIL